MTQGGSYMHMAIPGDQQVPPQVVAPSVQLAQQEDIQILRDRPDADAPPLPQEPMLQRAVSVTSGLQRVTWKVDGRRLKKTDKEAVSPPFNIGFHKDVQFRMVIRPTKVSDGKGG